MKSILTGISIFIFINTIGQQYPFQNPKLSPEDRIKDLIPRLTLEEKISLMCDQSEAIPRLGIRKFNWWSEALHGLANNDSVTVFPQPIGMAASFNDELVYKIFSAVSDETRAKYHEHLRRGGENKRFLSLSVWTPNINIFRDPRWGRGQETYGEDPYLMSRMGVAVVKGLQGPDTSKYLKLLACAKHYAVHSGPEWKRHEINLNDIDPRDLYETYLPAFKALVKEAGVRQVMCAYHRLDDEPCCGNRRLLQRILRDEWGYKHVVVSDCGAISDFYMHHKVSSTPTHAASKGVLAGTDIECDWSHYYYKNLDEAKRRDLIKEDDIDKSLERILKARIELGDFDPDSLVPWAKIPYSLVNCQKHKDLALEMARQSIVLLQNKNNILPLKKNIKRIAVIGPNADDEEMMWGNYNGTPIKTITILDGILTKIPKERVFYDRACDLVEDKIIQSYINKCSIDGKIGFKATYWNNPDFNGEPVTQNYVTEPFNYIVNENKSFAEGVKTEGFSAKYETEFLAEKDEELAIRYGATGYFEIFINDKSVARTMNWRTLPSKTYYKVEAGKKYKIVIHFKQLYNWRANIDFNFGKDVDVDFTELINKLKGIDIIIYVGGLSGRLEGEEMPVNFPGFKGGDRTNIELPGVQRNLLKALKQEGKKIIFVNCSGSAIALLPETQTCDAIVQAWYPGELGGLAVADVLFGDYNPSGKLPITFYKSSEQLPDFENYSMKGRTYRFMEDALFPFGYGLSYTTFKIGDAKINKTRIAVNDSVELSIPVTNTGKRDGTEIIQIYIRKVNDNDGPNKTLRGYRRVDIGAGKTVNVNIKLPYSSFEFYNRESGKLTVTPGEYEILYGNSSENKNLKIIKVLVM